MWKDYFPAVDAIVFLVDAYDVQRFPESKRELMSLLADEQLAHCPILILGNKIDRPGASSEDQIRSYFELHATTGKVYMFKKEVKLKSQDNPFLIREKSLDRNCLLDLLSSSCAPSSNDRAMEKDSVG